MKYIIEISERVVSHVKIDYMDISDNDRAMMCDAVRTAIPYEERPHGEWKADGTCSECGVYSSLNKNTAYFCPNCGSDNRKRGEVK